MLTSAQILLILTLFSLLLFVSHGEESLEVNTTANIADGLKNMTKEYVPSKREGEFNFNEENRETSNPNASNSSLWDESNESYGTTDVVDNLTTAFSRSPRPTPTSSKSSPSVPSVVSGLPWNSSVGESSLSSSALPNATSAESSETFTWSLDNDTMKTDNSSITVSILPSAPTITVNPMTMEPGEWLNTTSESWAGFTPYQERTLQPTLKFTNNSKIFPNTSDPQEENRNTGVVFGAILGAILGASLLSLVGYLLCGKRKMNSFSHRRLYDDRNEPVITAQL
uniref:Mucin 15, cell surface associated n=1 Tax=Molossus molossus TaxID=27622 RepID=A0A7J8ESM8_MOLMO|nr:mucin 15, cell surface associated [Molossus molossus]